MQRPLKTNQKRPELRTVIALFKSGLNDNRTADNAQNFSCRYFGFNKVIRHLFFQSKAPFPRLHRWRMIQLFLKHFYNYI